MMASTPQYPMPRYDAIGRRRELQELIGGDPYNLSVKAIDAYADTLANRFPGTDLIDRGLAHHMMVAYMDGWLAGNDDGYSSGTDSELDFALNLIEKARGMYGAENAALQWVEQRIKQERHAGTEQPPAPHPAPTA